MRRRGLAAAYVTAPISRRYLTGFTGTAGAVLVTHQSATFFTDFRYTERAESGEVAPSYDVVEVSRSATPILADVLKAEGIRRLGVEDRVLTVANHAILQRRLRQVHLFGLGPMLEELRGIKDDVELDALRRAVRATDVVFGETVRWLKHLKRSKRLPTEEAVAWKVRDIIHSRRLGEPAFDTIVASGKHAARPHHEPTTKRLKIGEMVIFDLGVKVDGYHADMTRTVFLGQPTSRQRAMYVTTLGAQAAAVRYLKRGGRRAAEADKVARRTIEAKFPGAFGHALGHGVGLEIHEHPTLSEKSKDVLRPGMVFSVEPGIYVPGEGGVRIEDLVLLKRSGSVVSGFSRTAKSVIL
jgi:Xaa-Pro aminopeptidase